MNVEAIRELAEQLTLRPEGWGVRVLLSILVIVVLALLRWLAVRLIERNVDDVELRFRLGKVTTYVAIAAALLALGRVWITGVGTLLTILGVLAAGLVIAMQDLVRNLVGGLYVAVRHPLRVGDRVEIDGVAGDVVNVGSIGFNLLEIQGWVDADQTTGRVMHIPNGLLLTRPLANYGAGFKWVWHEVTLPLTFDSDVDRARLILAEILERHAPELGEERDRSRDLLISFTRLQPAVYVSADERGVRVTGRLRVGVRQRRRIDHAVWTEVLRRLRDEPDITLTYAASRTELAGGVAIDRPAPAPAPSANPDGTRGAGSAGDAVG